MLSFLPRTFLSPPLSNSNTSFTSPKSLERSHRNSNSQLFNRILINSRISSSLLAFSSVSLTEEEEKTPPNFFFFFVALFSIALFSLLARSSRSRTFFSIASFRRVSSSTVSLSAFARAECFSISLSNNSNNNTFSVVFFSSASSFSSFS